MFKRRDFIKTCAFAGGVHLVGCGGKGENKAEPTSAPPAAAPAGSRTAGKAGPPPQPGVVVAFRGLFLFIVPASSGYAPVDIALVKAETYSGLQPHFGTLSIPRKAILATSSAVPVAADEQTVYFSLAGQTLQILPHANATTPPPAGDLTVGHDKVSQSDEADCAKNWMTIMRVINLKDDLWPGASLDPSWQSAKALYGRIALTHGHLQDKETFEPGPRYGYALLNTTSASKTRLVEERVKYVLDAPIVEFKMGDKSCFVDTTRNHFSPGDLGRLSIGIDHVPPYWMGADDGSDDPGPMTDFLAFTGLMQNVKDVTPDNVPSKRARCAGATTPSAPGCMCCPPAMLEV
jgi:hypothetical protein